MASASSPEVTSASASNPGVGADHRARRVAEQRLVVDREHPDRTTRCSCLPVCSIRPLRTTVSAADMRGQWRGQASADGVSTPPPVGVHAVPTA